MTISPLLVEHSGYFLIEALTTIFVFIFFYTMKFYTYFKSAFRDKISHFKFRMINKINIHSERMSFKVRCVRACMRACVYPIVWVMSFWFNVSIKQSYWRSNDNTTAAFLRWTCPPSILELSIITLGFSEEKLKLARLQFRSWSWL